MALLSGSSSWLSETQPFGSLTETYGYDSLGRRTSKQISDGAQSFLIQQSISDYGNPLGLAYPSGSGISVVSYGYDSALRPVSVTADGVVQALKNYGTGSGSAGDSTVVDSVIFGKPPPMPRY